MIISDQSASNRLKKGALSRSAWCRVAVTSSSEETFGFPDHSHAPEGLAFVELIIKFALVAVNIFSAMVLMNM